MRWLLALLLVLLAVLQYRFWFAEGSLAEQRRLERLVREQTETNRRLAERNALLESEVLELQQGNITVEQRAREELGLVKQGEVFYQVVPAEQLPAANPEPERPAQ